MELFEHNPDVPGGGRARGSGGSFHLSFRSGSRAGGSCARSAHAYITRSEEYDDPDRDAAIYVESDHMPEWVEDDAREYWDAADLYERANGRLYVSADFALPRDLEPEDHVELAHAFAQELTAREHLPYTLAVHAGASAAMASRAEIQPVYASALWSASSTRVDCLTPRSAASFRKRS